MKTIKMDVTKKEAAGELLNFLERKFENNTQASIGITIEEESAFIDYGFSCHKNEPDLIIFHQDFTIEYLGEIPNIDEWDDDIKDSIISYIEEILTVEIRESDYNIEFKAEEVA